MGIFSTNFRESVKSKFPDLKQVIASTPCQTVLASLNKYRSYLSTRTGVTDSFIGAFSVDSDLIADAFLDNAKIEFDSDNPTTTDVSDEVAEYMIDGLSDCIHEGRLTSEFNGVTITDSKGYAYNFIDQRDEHVVINDKEIIFSCNVDPVSLSDAIIYRDAAGYHLNNFVKTHNFLHINQTRYKPEGNIYDLIASIHYIIKGFYPATNNIEEIVRANFTWHDDLFTTLYDFVHHYEPALDVEDIYNCVSVAWDIVDTQHPLPVDGRGYVNSIWSIVKDNIESSALNSFILRFSNAVLSGMNVATELTTLVTEAISTKYNSIRRFGKGISTAFNRGGVYGVACYIMSYVKEICNVEEDDGTMKFTDNSRYAPAIYLAGIINTIVDVMSTVISLLVTIFSRIAGAALAIIGSVVSSIFKAFQYDYDSTNSAINTDSKVTIPITPYGMYQVEIPLIRITNSDLLSLFSQGENFSYCEIPGGYITMGPGSFSETTGEVLTVRAEFHPSIVDTGGRAVSRAFKWLHDKSYLRFTFDASNVYDIKAYPYIKSLDYDEANEIASKFMEIWNDELSNRFFENQSNEHLSNDDDLALRHIIIDNMSMGIIFLSVLAGDYKYYDSSKFKLHAWFGHDTTTFANNYSQTGSEGSGSGIWEPLVRQKLGYRFTETFTANGVTWYFNCGGVLSASIVELQWLGIFNQIVSPLSTGKATLRWLNQAWYFGELVCFNNDIQPAIFIPKYDKASFWGILIATMAVTALSAAAISIATFKVKRAITKKRAMNQAKVAAAYDDFTKHPTSDKYEVYRKSVKKNNLWANLIGGSKFDTESYWNGATNDTSEGSNQGEVTNPFNIIPSVIDGQGDQPDDFQLDNIVNNQGNTMSLERVTKLIAG